MAIIHVFSVDVLSFNKEGFIPSLLVWCYGMLVNLTSEGVLAEGWLSCCWCGFFGVDRDVRLRHVEMTNDSRDLYRIVLTGPADSDDQIWRL